MDSHRAEDAYHQILKLRGQFRRSTIVCSKQVLPPCQQLDEQVLSTHINSIFECSVKNSVVHVFVVARKSNETQHSQCYRPKHVRFHERLNGIFDEYSNESEKTWFIPLERIKEIEKFSVVH